MSVGFMPSIRENGVPMCTREECPQYDGKRCRMLGFKPSDICEPGVIELRQDFDRIRAKLARVRNLRDKMCDMLGRMRPGDAARSVEAVLQDLEAALRDTDAQSTEPAGEPARAGSQSLPRAE